MSRWDYKGEYGLAASYREMWGRIMEWANGEHQATLPDLDYVAEICRETDAELNRLRTLCDHLDHENVAYERLHHNAVEERDHLRIKGEEWEICDNCKGGCPDKDHPAVHHLCEECHQENVKSFKRVEEEASHTLYSSDRAEDVEGLYTTAADSLEEYGILGLRDPSAPADKLLGRVQSIKSRVALLEKAAEDILANGYDQGRRIALRAALRAAKDGPGMTPCPYCGGGKKYGHYPGCPNIQKEK